MTYTPPPPPPESPVPTQETEDSYTSVDPTLSAPSWRDEDSWSAQPADDDSRWRNANAPAPPSASDPYGRGGAASSDLAACERSLGRALRGERARTLLGSIFDSGCTALKGSKEDPAPCARCRSCPSEGMWQHMRGYYNPQKRRVTLCADKRLDEKEVEDTLVHELVHAYDHCRFSMRVPMVGRQHPWALNSFGAPPGGGGDGASGSIAHAAEEQRGEVHSAALRSLQHYGTCADARLDPRGVLDSVFYACLADTAPFKRGAPQPHTEPMPAAVAEAEK
ncbi:hypothetical protein EMIHUDRAFT_224296 [Emiliania huxleyi CCMP1516]|uniref:Mitochondrial inner membrane protease ATP23 n=2 Tax=Emiliania huxleyi TaxID=2903 RepID=A0A0D3KS12_EMIH1|nr:hypothetical protein EMIHUDRAFT_221882 [Emiliania huxleyi CCMP1516]XP_005790976.1 hypothetical protein EMIHUDRAFT_224296 [Emiliania huxleyi CCMP1516]EOD03732.1 hypothetical protein EMIHUDRAFT_221882 [Emiliania huxleyi CCMP1516]EOD38547.1 hypothetical protein EMIHUDRAFT_224296 [Emiliania huxleyi CCMP1516]|eukprot:XP_005756161.1 hypothetical protein EMIHUDRAFT_221882 [Emiliania huxleyi CCMP1516]